MGEDAEQMIIDIIMFIVLVVLLLSISIQLQKIIRLLIVIALKADYVAAKKASGQDD